VHHQALGGLEVLRAAYTTHTFAKHSHDEYVVAVMERGGEAFHCNGRRWVAPASAIVVINPGEAHDGRSATGGAWSYLGFYPSAHLVDDIGTDLGIGKATVDFPKAVIHDHELARLLCAAHRSLEEEGTCLDSESALYCALGRLVSLHASTRQHGSNTRARHRRAIDRAVEIIHAHWAHTLSLNDLAQQVGLSRFHLLRAFEREVGLPPHAFQLNLRIRRARTLLAAGCAAADVAAETGFCDQSHLARRFRAIVGVSPSTYAAARARPH